jgi:hypothetical protein
MFRELRRLVPTSAKDGRGSRYLFCVVMLWTGRRRVDLLNIGSRRLNRRGVTHLNIDSRRLNQPPQCRFA